MTMKKYTCDEFIALLDDEKTGVCIKCNKINFEGWDKLTSEMETELDTLGEHNDADKFINQNGYTEYHPNGTNYWSKDAPIALAYYPYHESVIRRCKTCKAVFLTYTEYGGHAPQNRCRWVQGKLIVKGSL